MAYVTPHIVVRDAGRAAEWYERALDAKVGSRIPVPDGRFMQIELFFGESRVMIADEFPEFGAVSPLTLGGTYGALTITTDAVDGLWQQALGEGAEVHSPLQDAFWGERHGQIIDPFGHRWGLAQHREDVPHEEIVRRAAELFGAAAPWVPPDDRARAVPSSRPAPGALLARWTLSWPIFRADAGLGGAIPSSTAVDDSPRVREPGFTP